MENLKHIIESLLFVAEEPISLNRFKRVIPPAEGREIKQALAELIAEYETRGGGFYLDEVAGGWQIRTRPEYNEWIRKMIQPKPLRLSKAALETLVIVAYKQPIIRSDIEYLRGVDCGGVLRVLLERKLIRVLGRREIAGRPMIYATTKRFLEVFDLKDLKDLPTPKEIEELGASLNESGNEIDLESPEKAQDESRLISEPHAAPAPSNDPENESNPHVYLVPDQPESAEEPAGPQESPPGDLTAAAETGTPVPTPAPSADADLAERSPLQSKSDRPPEEPRD
jgi:segregation and condensation protein B